MKKLTTLFIICILSLGIQAQVGLVPVPQSITMGEGCYALPAQPTIVYAQPALKPAAAYLQACLQRFAQAKATSVAGKQGDIRLSLKKGIAKDGYQLHVTASGIDITAADYGGILSAIATLNQLVLTTGTVPIVSISDAPRFGWRGFHLDVSRHFFTVDEVKEVIDLMALYKLNRFHWHLTDDQGWRLEIKKYPKLTEKGAWRIYNDQDTACWQIAARDDNPDMLVPKKNTRVENGDTLYGGYYTQEQIRDIVAYARQRAIEIIPEIDMPGHFLSAIENYDGLACFDTIGWGKYFTTPLCPGKQKVLDFCKDIWREVFELFPYEYVHIGGDEVRKDTWKECPDCQKRIKDNSLKNEEELQSWFIHQMEAFINKNGRKMIGWDEILEGELSKTATVTWWRTWVPDAPGQVTAQGNDVIYCPGSPMYLSQAEEKTSMRSIYEYDVQPATMTAKQKQHVIGVQGNLWCEYIPSRDRMLFMYFPRILALSELAWTKPELKDYDQFYSRLPQQFAMLHKLNVPFRTPSLDGVYRVNAFTREGRMAVTCADPLATVRYTTDGSFPNRDSKLYAGPVTFDETTRFILRTFSPSGRAGEMIRADYFKQGLLEPVQTDGSKLKSGLTAAWHDYQGETCREIHQRPFKGNYEINDVVIPEGVKGNIGLIITGYLKVPEDGVYTFSLMSDDGSWLKLDGNMVVDNDRPQSPHEEVSQQALKAGLHKIEVRYFDSNGGMLRLWVFDPQGRRMSPAEIYLTVSAQEKNEEIISTTSGLVSGTMQEGTMAWLGIPYAKIERLMPPQPVEKWEGVRACDHWGPQTLQPTWGKQLTEDEMSEKNCCVLNVWTTDTKARKPVMLWLHGGGFDSGTSAWDPGMQLAKKDVVVVSINHRLNILGFLDLSAVSDKYKYSGNVGMLDVVQALEWIRDNIANFGGDPQNVTVFGESGGGGKVGTLMCMPAAKGLFHKAIIMSGTILNVNNHDMTQQLGNAVLKELGISENEVDRIKDVPYQTLYDAGQRAMAASIGTRKPGTPMMWGFGPTPDGETLLQQPFQPNFASISDHIPVMIGTTFNELQRLHYDRELTLADAKKALEPTFGDETEAYVAAFAKAYPDYTPQDLLSIDWLFRPKTIITADAIAGTRKAPTYMYMFTWRSPLNNGSIHGHELKFSFNTLHRAKNDLPQPTAEDLKLADTMSSVWAQFAKTGNPQIRELPVWHPYTAENGELMVFNHRCYIRNNPDRELEQIIDRHCFKQLDAFRSRK